MADVHTDPVCSSPATRAHTPLCQRARHNRARREPPPDPHVTESRTTSEQRVMTKHRIYTTSVASVYPHYLAKAEKKGRTKGELDEILRWLTGYSQTELEGRLRDRTDFETFFADAPALNPARAAIKGTICGVRIEAIEEPTMREIRYLDKLVDELAKGRPMEKILRKP